MSVESTGVTDSVFSPGFRDDVVSLATLLSDWSVEETDPSRRHRFRRAAAALLDLVQPLH